MPGVLTGGIPWVILRRTSGGGFTPSSTGFEQLALSTDQPEIVLVTLALRAKGSQPARTARISDRELTDLDGNRWDALLLEKSTLDCGGDYIEDGWQPADYDLVVADGRLNFQTSVGDSAADLLWKYELIGTPVTVQLGAEALATADWVTVFEGEVDEVLDLTPTSFWLRCVQTRKWIVALPDKTVDRNAYAEAPQSVVGEGIPVVYGNFSAHRYTLNVPSPGNKATWLAGVARAPLPMIPIDGGTSANPAWLLSSHALYSPLNAAAMILDSQSEMLVGTTYVTDAIDAEGNQELRLTSTDYSKFTLCVLPVDPHAGNTCTSWQEAVRKDKNNTLTGAALVDYDSGEDVLKFTLPEMDASRGEFVSAKARVWYAKTATSSVHPVLGVARTGLDDTVSLPAGASSSFPSDTPLGYADVDLSVQITSWDHFPLASLYLRVYNAGESVQVHRICVTVEYVPSVTVVSDARGNQRFEGPSYTVSGRKNQGYQARTRYYGTSTRLIPQTTSFDSTTYTYQSGHQDTAGGTYTGTGDALIEHPGDIVRHALVTYGDVTDGTEIVTASSTWGSFVDLRTSLLGYKAQVYQQDVTDLEAFIADIGKQFLVWFFRRNTAADQPWVAIPWDVGTAANYKTTANVFAFSPDYLVGPPKVGLSSISKVKNIVRVNYDYDMRLRTYAEQCFITDEDSRGYSAGLGYEYRDQGGDREIKAWTSVNNYGRRELTLNLSMVNDPATATSVRNRIFDLLYRPRVEVRFTTLLNAYDLERGQVIQLGEDWDALMPYPLPGSDGSWYAKNFRVLRTTRKEGAGASTYDVTAVEV